MFLWKDVDATLWTISSYCSFNWNSLIEINLQTETASYRSIHCSVGNAVKSSRLELVSQESKHTAPGFQKYGVA